jgi:Ca2+-binding RTX toxin-like protein
MPVDGTGAPTRVTTTVPDAFVEAPDWSPDGTAIVYTLGYATDETASGYNYELRSINVDGTNPRVLRDTHGGHAVWSPAGDRIAVTARGGIDIMAPDGTDVERFTGTDRGVVWLDWAAAPSCSVQGTPGEDVLRGTAGDDTICAGDGADRVIATGGQDVVLGGRGIDKVDYRDAPHRTVVDLRQAKGSAGEGTSRLLGVEAVLGTAYADEIYGRDVRDVLSGYGGDDALIGRGGDDTLNGGDGDDLLRPGPDGDDVNGGDGRDSASYRFARERVRINLEDGFAFGEGQDILLRIEKIVGSEYDDFIVGDDNANILRGGDGEDTLDGQAGPDDVYGGDDRDFLFGRSGADDLYGDGGRDYIDGGQDDDDCFSAYSQVAC